MSRLPQSVIPVHYSLSYTSIDFLNGPDYPFEGEVSIDLKVLQETKSIELHVLDLSIISAEIPSFTCEELSYDVPNQICKISFDKSLEAQDCTLNLKFHSKLNRNMAGLYLSQYNEGSVKKNMVCTQFEPTDARRAFPCFDEPALKATFQLKVNIINGYLPISNTPVEAEHTIGSGVKEYLFAKTPKMSTYLLALVVGEFDSISKTSLQTRIQTRIFTVPGKADQATFCLDVASNCLDYYEGLFNVPYPLPKSDLLAIPDFAAGAMENWGCVTYREAKILVKEGMTSTTIKQGIARTVCHELAHQWFGNLVTMDFWTQLWLNEGFARYMEFVGVDKLFPSWDVWTEFVQSVYGMVLNLDALESSHPVEVEVKHPDEIKEIFDSISYAKGASVIRMISSYLGFDVFMDGLRVYLEKYSYSNATTDMLWQALEDVSNKPVKKLMNPWTSQMGYPVLKINENGKIACERYLASGPSEKADGYKWPIPVTAMVEGSDEVLGPWIIHPGEDDDQTDLLAKNIDLWEKIGWFKLNINQTGFYRVLYSSSHLNALGKVLAPGGSLSASDRLGVLSDVFAMGKGGYASIVDALELAYTFSTHVTSEYAVWEELSDNLGSLASLYRSEHFFHVFQKYLTVIYVNQLTVLGWVKQENEGQRVGTLRATIIRMLGVAGYEPVRLKALSMFRNYAEDSANHPIDGDMRRVIFKIALDVCEEEIFDSLKDIYETSTFPEEQRDCLLVMGRVKDTKRHTEMLYYVLHSGNVRLQDMIFPINALCSSSDSGGEACWEYLKTNFESLESKFKNAPMWAPFIAISCRGLRTLKKSDDVELFFKTHSVGKGNRRLLQALESVRTNAKRLDRDREAVSSYLAGLDL